MIKFEYLSLDMKQWDFPNKKNLWSQRYAGGIYYLKSSGKSRNYVYFIFNKLSYAKNKSNFGPRFAVADSSSAVLSSGL